MDKIQDCSRAVITSGRDKREMAGILPSHCPRHFLAIDFETANSSRDSACAVGVVRVQQRRVTGRWRWLLRPPNHFFEFTHIHGLTWADVSTAPTFAERWPDLLALIDAAEVIAAHNAAFDLSVLRACCILYGLQVPRLRSLDTVQLARRKLGIYPTKLNVVCQRLAIPLNHHDPLSDAEACAMIVLAATE